jgi:NAD(P)-dependent dehydrogenase (short-subunit alcohol dehydrogenase family)
VTETAVVTQDASDVGAAIVQRLSANGFNVAAFDLNLSPAFPWLEAANKYLEEFPLADGLPEPERNLLLLMMSLVMASFPVEFWQQPHVPDSRAAYLDLIIDPRV